MEREIFVLDGEKGIRMLYEEVLCDEIPRLKIKSFDNSFEMLEELRYRRSHDELPDLIIQDIFRKCLNGFKTAEEIQKVDPNQRIFMSSTLMGSYFSEFMSYNIAGFFEKQIDLEPFVELVENALDRVPSGINVIVAPSGGGKSKLLDNLARLGIPKMPKYTTRYYRDYDEKVSGEIKSVSREEFVDRVKKNEIIGAHEYHGNLYGMPYDKLLDCAKNSRECVFAFVDPIPALQIKYTFPRRTNLIAVSPDISSSGIGLEERMRNLFKATEGYCSVMHEYAALQIYETSVEEVQKRLKTSRNETLKFNRLLPFFDYIVEGSDLDRASKEIFDYISRQVK